MTVLRNWVSRVVRSSSDKPRSETRATTLEPNTHIATEKSSANTRPNV
jgi:hypothetical protein